MRWLFILILFCFSIPACTEKKAESSVDVTGAVKTVKAKESKKEVYKRVRLVDLKNHFKFTNLEAFAIDTFSWDTRPGNYMELDSTNFNLVWQDGKRTFLGQGYDRDYFYSWQTRSSNFIEFVILTQDESSYCDLLKYCIYDKKGKAVDNFILAASCGDGGWAYQSTGKFISKDTYEEVSVETESELVESNTINEIIEGDSIITHFTIGKDGKVKKKEIYKTKIRKEI